MKKIIIQAFKSHHSGLVVMYSHLLKLINLIAELDKKEIELIKSSFKPLYLAKGTFFLKAGEINKHVGFIHKGLVRYFVYKN